ncbi:MAG: VPLPA-CTERM sorting domain-containing protein [Pseudomonadota bacterium]
MTRTFLTVAAAALTLIMGTVAHASTMFSYQLDDHPNGGKSATYDYGLRLDRESPDMFFSLSTKNGADAYMSYDAAAGTAVMYGTLVQSLGNGVFGNTFTFQYNLSGLTDDGNGGFTDTTGKGSGFVFGAGAGGSDLSLGAAAKKSNLYAGEYFRFGLDALSDRPHTGFEGTGWVQSGPGANDFLFTATIATDAPPPPQVPNVPLPAAGWMLLLGLGAIGAVRRVKA